MDVLRSIISLDTFRITVCPLYPGLYWTTLVFLLGCVAMSGVSLRWPWWTRQRAAARLALDVLGLLVCVVIAANPFVEITAANPNERVIALARWANVSWDFTMGIVGLTILRESFWTRAGSPVSSHS